MVVECKLPKQWLYWVRKSGLKPERKRGRFNGFYLVGRDRFWRVNCFGDFECSCPVRYFDRWANSHGAEWDGLPQTENEFLIAVRSLLDKTVDCR